MSTEGTSLRATGPSGNDARLLKPDLPSGSQSSSMVVGLDFTDTIGA